MGHDKYHDGSDEASSWEIGLGGIYLELMMQNVMWNPPAKK